MTKFSVGTPPQFQDQLSQLNACTVLNRVRPVKVLLAALTQSRHSSEAGDNVAIPS